MNQRYKNTKLVPVMLNGAKILINPASIDKSNRTVLHGEYKGTKVNSPALCPVGESVVFWPDADKSLAISMDKATAGVFATQFLQSEGHTVTLAGLNRPAAGING